MPNKRAPSSKGKSATALAKPSKSPSSKSKKPAPKGSTSKTAASTKQTKTTKTRSSKPASSKASSKSSSKVPAASSSSSKARPKSGEAAADTLEQIERMLRRKAGVTSFDTFGCIGESEEDYFVVPREGETFGRCGGREILSKMEKRVCDKLSESGVAHCHRPRRYEVRVEDSTIAAYSPCIALRGRGREGKTAILEVMAEADSAHVAKLQAFRKLYESEFYVTLVVPGHVLDELPRDCFDESVLPSELGSLVARLAE